VYIDGSNFSIVSGGGTFNLFPDGTRNITVRFYSTGTLGLKTATLIFVNNVPGKNPFNVPLKGKVVIY
jgi:hypothetical protein